jgi:FG-GAP repeat
MAQSPLGPSRKHPGRLVGPLFWGASILCWLAAAFVLASPLPAASQTGPPQLEAKLVGADAVGPAEQGWSVALSADGNTAVLGGIVDNKLTGAAWVFTFSRATTLSGTSKAANWSEPTRSDKADRGSQ